MAALRFSTVLLTPFITRKWAWACTVSASAAARKSLAIYGCPSASAFLAKARYFRLAWLSPANASCRLSVVDIGVPPFPRAGRRREAARPQDPCDPLLRQVSCLH